ncbi:MAG: hypothetical protein KGJ43_02860, partial [Acidobacteriota bacterium]|nr:hypothetical protein [Acidobacteriota bacterium]
TFGHNAALAAIVGSPRRLDTIGGTVGWRVFGLLIILGAVWGMMAATRALRREEDAGRWELLLAGATARGRAAAQALAGLAAGWFVLWAVTVAFTVAAGLSPRVGFSVSESIYYATAVCASAAIFLAIGAVCSQMAGTRRQANGCAAAAFAVAFLVRMAADSVSGLGWMRWMSPLGWVENMRPLTGTQPLALVPIALLVGAAATLTVWLAGRRDAGSAVLAPRRSPRAEMRLLGSPLRFAIRLERWVVLAWIGGIALLALIFGVVARSAATASAELNESLVRQVGRLGGHHGGAAAAWVGYEFIYVAALVAFAAAGQIAAMRGEEADGQLENLLARGLGRRAWLAGRLGVGLALVLACGIAAGLAGWAGLAGSASGVGLAAMMQADLNPVALAVFVLGLGTLLYGLLPRLAAPILYGVILWSFLVEAVGSSFTSSHLLLDTALLSHLGPVPAAALNWGAIAWLGGAGVLAALAGSVAFGRRDLAGA